jgi:hypothetical protein
VKQIERATEIITELLDAIDKAPKKTIEQRLEEGEKLREVISSEVDPYDGWSKAFETDAPTDSSLPKITLWVLSRFGRFSPMTMKGIRNDIYKRTGEKSGSVHVAALEQRRLVRVKEVDGRSVWEITEKGRAQLNDVRGNPES